MAGKEKMLLDVKWATRQRLEFIEVMAYYAGVVSRSDVATAFGLSDAAATKDLKLYNDLAPDNLVYRHNVFGFVPTEGFIAQFADLSPARVLPLLAQNQVVFSSPGDTPLYGLSLETLPLPLRLPEAAVLAQITRAIRGHNRLRARYRSLSGSAVRERVLEPHALVHTGQRWHVRAYSTDSYDFRDFVLSRFESSRCLDEAAESSVQYDDDWVEYETLTLAPHPGLEPAQRQSLLLDYGANDDTITITVRRALLGYVLQRLTVDTSRDHSQNPQVYQLVLVNRDEIEAFADWLFDD